MESNRPWLFLILFLALAFILLMASLGALRVEKHGAPNARWRQVHLVWDWNRMADWWREVTPWTRREPGGERPAGPPLDID